MRRGCQPASHPARQNSIRAVAEDTSWNCALSKILLLPLAGWLTDERPGWAVLNMDGVTNMYLVVRIIYSQWVVSEFFKLSTTTHAYNMRIDYNCLLIAVGRSVVEWMNEWLIQRVCRYYYTGLINSSVYLLLVFPLTWMGSSSMAIRMSSTWSRITSSSRVWATTKTTYSGMRLKMYWGASQSMVLGWDGSSKEEETNT